MLQKNTMTALNKESDILTFSEKFQVPEVARQFVTRIFTEEEIQFVVGFEGEEIAVDEKNQEYLQEKYRKGIVSLKDETAQAYRLGNFYGMLDVYAVSQKERYDRFTKEEKKLLDDWYFQSFFEGLTFGGEKPPTPDKILPLDKVIDFIDQDDRDVYLNFCDCRSLTGDCGLPTKTCITYKSGINTFAHRGLSEKIDKEKAKEVVRQADKAGLMHTVNDHGICNCCGDCCYLFRGQQAADSKGTWPATETIVEIETDQCIRCGLCVKRCHFGVFTKEDKILCDSSKCVGCGICVTTCPGKALHLKER